ncbi:MAG: FMN reductase, partial [uncultured Blastococcus sp.]
DHPHPRRRQRRPQQPLVDPAARRPAHRGDGGRPPGARRGHHRRGRRAAGPRPRPGRRPGDRVRQPGAADGDRHGHRRRRADRRHTDLLGLLQRPVQDVLRRPGQGLAGGQAGAARRHGGHRPALPRPRARRPAAVLLPARGSRADRGVRRDRGLGRRRRDRPRPGRADRPRRRRARRPDHRPARDGATDGPLRRPDDVLRGPPPRPL